MGPQDNKEFPFAPTDTATLPASAAEDSPLPDVIVKLAPESNTVEHCKVNSTTPSAETHISIGCQVVVPFLIAGMGMVGAGFYLDHVQDWEVFMKVPEIIILVPSLLGLKGNLEMTLASRLSTEANLGHMDDPKEQWSMILGNLTLVQCQAIVVGLMSAVVAIAMVAVTQQEFSLSHTLLLCSCSIITSSIASLLLGFITATVIVVSRYFNVNPDNVATPIAASLGDITSLILLSWVASILHDADDKFSWISSIIIGCYILVIPFWVFIAKKNKYTHSILYTGWTPVVVAMLISTLAGLILDILMAKYKDLAVYQPVINGVGGNLVSVQASRLSTELHKDNELGTLPPTARICISPLDAFFSKQQYAMTARVLMLVVVPGHLIFVYAIRYFKEGNASPTKIFIFFYLTAALVQVAILLYVAYVITYYFWSRKVDPDNSTIPYLTALGDFLGIMLLGITFEFLYLLGDIQLPT
ncbi:Solute carrier family 41 member 1 [Cryptotermes secundus]|uniref:Solute carrier family 41 member 1 n=3 Tax=Cryptotermes secundus TaxID=105785 RepID=A0A2J7PP23_9NEOP|nr:solute carrier family 41 member 1 isoform X3 [Cryptotermes secundus]XP_023722571.1 solute carrier family 41 member 1 isoform X3 [Cryptotermes secundus]XP_033610675.1 solute carrier family 41 member 1 isoform X3 [Cryptotermes secundus]PNF18092.1 Solute carrier family 41 member 1 [Cryptotermes secundus]